VEDALHAFDIWRVAVLFDLPRLMEAAEARLMVCSDTSSSSALRCGDAVAMPLFAASFGHRCPTLSEACFRHLTDHSEAVLYSRERQLGVLYATHAMAASALSGIMRTAAAKGSSAGISDECSSNQTANSLAVD